MSEEQAPPQPPRIINSPLETGTSTLLDGTPIVFMDDTVTKLRHVMNLPDALKLGLALIRCTEHAVTNTLVLRSLTEKGMRVDEATVMVQAFQNERKKLLVQQIDDAVKKGLQEGPDGL